MGRAGAKDTNRKRKTSENRERNSTEDFKGTDYADASSSSQQMPERAEGSPIDGSSGPGFDLSSDVRQQIAEQAFSLYAASGYKHGADVEHWLEAERQIKGARM